MERGRERRRGEEARRGGQVIGLVGLRVVEERGSGGMGAWRARQLPVACMESKAGACRGTRVRQTQRLGMLDARRKCNDDATLVDAQHLPASTLDHIYDWLHLRTLRLDRPTGRPAGWQADASARCLVQGACRDLATSTARRDRKVLAVVVPVVVQLSLLEGGRRQPIHLASTSTGESCAYARSSTDAICKA